MPDEPATPAQDQPPQATTPDAAAAPTPTPSADQTSAAPSAPDATPSDATSAAVIQAGGNPNPKSGGYYWGTGRRKSAVARVRIRPGSGKFLIQKRDIDDYFAELRDRNDVVAPMKATDTLGKFDVFVNVHGGGRTGQAQAILLGVARALVKADPSHEPKLRDGRYLTRDSREVERKKPGQPGARKRFQFSKR